MSLLGNIASSLGRNLETYVHNREQQRFSERMRQDERAWQQGIEEARMKREETLSELQFNRLVERDEAQFNRQVERDEAQFNRQVELAQVGAEAQGEAAQVRDQREVMNQQAGFTRSNLERAQDRLDSILKQISESGSAGEYGAMSQRDRAMLEQEYQAIKLDIEAILTQTDESVIAYGQLQPLVNSTLEMQRRIEAVRAAREAEVLAEAEKARQAEEEQRAEAERRLLSAEERRRRIEEINAGAGRFGSHAAGTRRY